MLPNRVNQFLICTVQCEAKVVTPSITLCILFFLSDGRVTELEMIEIT